MSPIQNLTRRIERLERENAQLRRRGRVGKRLVTTLTLLGALMAPGIVHGDAIAPTAVSAHEQAASFDGRLAKIESVLKVSPKEVHLTDPSGTSRIELGATKMTLESTRAELDFTAAARLRSAATEVRGTGRLDLRGGLVVFNRGKRPAAGLGDRCEHKKVLSGANTVRLP